MEHVRRLVALGARGSGSVQEAQAAAYAAGVLRAAGLEPQFEEFQSARSAWYPYVLFAGVVLVAEVFLLVGGRRGAVAAFCLTIFTLGAALLELAFRDNPLRWALPTVTSQNVVARVAPRGAARARVVLLGHLDSHRTPHAFSSDPWVRRFTWLVPGGLLSVAALIVLEALATFGVHGPWHLVSVPLGVIAAVLFVLTAQADLTPFSVGANDNATGSAVVLDLAVRLHREPLAATEVYAVLTGCEEVGCYGAEAFARAHDADLGGAAWIAVDSVGGRGAAPSYLVRESFLLTTRSDRDLVRRVEAIGRRRPELGLRPAAIRGAFTEGSVGARHGHRVITFLAFDERGALPEWHRPTDVLERVDPDVVVRTEAALWELLHDLDAAASAAGAVPRDRG